jgi:hypothetical protein
MASPPPADRSVAQWITGPRLLKLGEEITFDFFVPPGAEVGRLEVFTKYLGRGTELAQTSDEPPLAWLDSLPRETHELRFNNGHATFSYRPTSTGNYITRWTANGELFHRYFSVIEDDFIVLRFSSFIELESEPTLHPTGIPIDYRLPVDQFLQGVEVFEKLLGYHRLFGDAVIPEFPDTPPTGETAGMTVDDRVRDYGNALEHVRSLLPDPSDARSARIQFRHAADPGYVQVFEQLGLNDHFGLQEPNILPWLGMPEFPYFASPQDFRKPRQKTGGSVVSHTWDFCAGFHFIGPISWHYAASENDFSHAETCIRNGMDELRNMAELSGYPAIANPLYDGATRNYGYPNGEFNEGYGGPQILKFVERWQQLVAHQLTREYKLVFARSIDIADYYRRHFEVTPRTVFSSKSNHTGYDAWWNCAWGRNRTVTVQDRIPWDTRISEIMKRRGSKETVNYVNLVTGKEVTAVAITKDPISSEHLLIEDHRRSIRFERESPNPIWWFDYTTPDIDGHGSNIRHTMTPDVEIVRTPWSEGPERRIDLSFVTEAEFENYAITIWGVPAKFSTDRSRIKTNARDFVLAKNRDGAFHVVLFLGLKPGLKLFLSVCDE